MSTNIDLKVKTIEINDIVNEFQLYGLDILGFYSRMFFDNSDVIIVDKETLNEALKIIDNKIN